jgi:oxygen-independent coproporphyrinogen-3 oxidase
MPAGIYLHIPFCHSKCPYCDFFSVEKDDDLINEFCDAILNEIHLLSKTKWKDRVYNTIYFGGGTPPLIGAANIESIITALRGTFNISPRSEITIEANPESVDADFFRDIKQANVNRVSIGVQSFNDDVLKTLGRIHDASKAGEAIDMAKAAGFERLSIDLIFGVPNQTIESWENTLWETVNKNPVHVSAYGLTIEKGTPFDKMIGKGELLVPDSDIQAEMYQLMCKILADAGFKRYEVSNFAKFGYESQHNIKYWRDDKYLGLGPSAHSYDGETRCSNYKNLDKYITSIKKGKTPVNFKEKLTEEQRAEERLLLGLRLAEGIDYNIVKNIINEDALAEMKEQGYITKKINNLMLTDTGFLVADDVIVKLLRK